jgi:hypothetical protein
MMVDSSGGWLLETDGDSDQTIGALLAIQFDDQGQPIKFGLAHDLLVPASGRAIVELALHTPGSDGVQVWRTQAHDDTEAPCVLVTTGEQDQPFESFSRPNDQDCDAAMPECDKYGVFGDVPPNDNNLTCVIEGITNKCELGGLACMDNVQASTVCSEPNDPWCLATAMCVPLQNCKDSGAACLPTVLRMTGATGAPFLHCIFPLGSDMLPCPGEPDLEQTVDLTPIGPTCAEAKVAALGSPLMWDSSAKLSTNDTTMVTIDGFDNNACTIDLSVTEPLDATIGAVGLLEVKTKTNPPVHHVVPIVITHEGADCATPPMCAAIMPSAVSDSLFKCR